MSASAGFNPADPPGTGRFGVHTPRIPPPPHWRFIRGETAPVASPWNTLQAPLHRPGGTRPAVLTPARFASTISFDEGTINQSKYTLKKPSDCPTNQDHPTFLNCAPTTRRDCNIDRVLRSRLNTLSHIWGLLQ